MTINAESGATGAYQPAEGGSELVRVLDQYLADLQAGRAPDRAQLLAAHPDLASQLEQCLAGIEFIHQAAQPTPETPAQLGDFRIIREVGRGGMGVVYEAEQLSLKRKVALKVLRFGAVADAEVMQRFQREAETVARLHHTNIVPVFAVGDEHGVHYYAMQFIAGQSLAAVLEESQAQGTPLEPREIARWGLQAAEALAHAHQRGVIHRDIKPSNLLLDPEGVVWLTDFGLARRVDEVVLTATGVLIGTPRYMSPEQAAAVKQPVDHRTDIYSLGATLYELATGKPVFDADAPQRILSQIQNTQPVAPRHVRHELPRDLETMILKCLAKEPAQRYATAQALAEDLRAFGDGRPIQARRMSLVERLQRWARYQRVTVRAVLTAILWAAALFITLAFWILRNQYITHELQRVSCQFTTNGPDLTVEVLDNDDQPIVPRFAVPNSEPIRLPKGTYRLLAARKGALGVIQPFSMRPNMPTEMEFGRQEQVQLNPANGNLWHQPVRGGEQYAVVDFQGKSDVVVLAANWCRRLGGATGEVIWETPLVEARQFYPAPHTPVRTADPGQSRLLQPAPDLDGDGVPDLVWIGQNAPALVALSGKSGAVLWSFQAWSDPPAGAAAPEGWVAGTPAVLDIDGDGTPDLIAVFCRWAGPKGKLEVALQAISGRTGNPLWTVPLDQYGHSRIPTRLADMKAKVLNGYFRYRCAQLAPRIVAVERRPVVVCAPGRHLVGVDAHTGKDAWPARNLGFQPVSAPKFADLAGDGRVDAMLMRREDSSHMRLVAMSLPGGEILWEASWPGFPEPRFLWDHYADDPTDGPLLADLEGSGKLQVIVRQTQRDGYGYGRIYDRLGVAVLDGATGRTRWQRWLGVSRREDAVYQTPMRLQVGPDLDQDGQREVFVATLFCEPWHGISPHTLYVDALSGRDGHSLWWWRQWVDYDFSGAKALRQPLQEFQSMERKGVGLGRLHWWPADGTDTPQLVVPYQVRGLQNDRSRTWVLDSRSGRLTAVAPQFLPLGVADVSGTGHLNLFGLTPSEDSEYNLRAWREPALPEKSAAESPSTPDRRSDPRLERPLPWNRDPYELLADWLIYNSGFPFWVLPAFFLFGIWHLQAALWPPNDSQVLPFHKRNEGIWKIVSVWGVLFALGLTVLVPLSWLIYDARFLEGNEHYGWNMAISFPLFLFLGGLILFWCLAYIRKWVVSSYRIILAVFRQKNVGN